MIQIPKLSEHIANMIKPIRISSGLTNLDYLKPIELFDPHKYDTYKKYRDEIEKNENILKQKNRELENIDNELFKIGIPKHTKEGIISLILFSIVGVIVPIILLPISYKTHLVVKWYVIPFFIAGFISVFVYIFSEIKFITQDLSKKS